MKNLAAPPGCKKRITPSLAKESSMPNGLGASLSAPDGALECQRGVLNPGVRYCRKACDTGSDRTVPCKDGTCSTSKEAVTFGAGGEAPTPWPAAAETVDAELSKFKSSSM